MFLALNKEKIYEFFKSYIFLEGTGTASIFETGSGSGSEIPDLQFKDPDQLLFISDPEHCGEVVMIT